jgi:hypothetical protein
MYTIVHNTAVKKTEKDNFAMSLSSKLPVNQGNACPPIPSINRTKPQTRIFPLEIKCILRREAVKAAATRRPLQVE